MAQPFDPETAGNAAEIEQQFAVKTVEHLETYEKLITSLPPNKLKLTPIDDEIHEHFLTHFPEYKWEDALRNLDEDEMKSSHGKEKWRHFIQVYEKKLKDYNFGTLVRKDSEKLYSEENSILVTRIQFFAIEISRNRAGLNDKIYHEAQRRKKAS
ncbi:hypothetical protein TREMEDRAFT_27063 [Tremella mesenterica DSM 1558]|uniref:uncharacterized protein n=1 Tax=Tremella mesenterica (strain ATCC 24925 / CBS 8224 / DSM 1558 / NBRC 9311 / NRRL Y-6157 / RJB 2259-6 / UBC 559-6) TaxID=578456 RepID=UPI0003F4A20F|nr:uncharacterized protein TREMEDRAFT_27063 [Tremella mesenterica DSM 1558]EIW71163.1 hypothetical protein TREMEDRAFT_27063 [Tremella mesenterica DSM 1558]